MNIKGLTANSADHSRPNEYLYNGKMMQDEMGLNWLDYGTRFYDPVLGRWHSPNPFSEVNRRWSPYRYGYDNPMRFIDPDGMLEDWYRNDETGAVFWSSSTANTQARGGQEYRNIGTSYSTYAEGTRYDYNQGEVSNISNASPRFNLEGGQYIPKTITTDDGSKVNVTFNYNSPTGGNGDKAISKEAVTLLVTGVNEANNSGAKIKSVDVSTSSTGKHSSTSANYVSRGARAVDIDAVNGVAVKNSKSHKQVDAIQNGMKKDPNLRENYGPNIQEKGGKKITICGHDNHIHASTKWKKL